MVQLNVGLYLTDLTDENESEVKREMYNLFKPSRMVRVIVDGKLSNTIELEWLFNKNEV